MCLRTWEGSGSLAFDFPGFLDSRLVELGLELSEARQEARENPRLPRAYAMSSQQRCWMVFPGGQKVQQGLLEVCVETCCADLQQSDLCFVQDQELEKPKRFTVLRQP